MISLLEGNLPAVGTGLLYRATVGRDASGSRTGRRIENAKTRKSENAKSRPFYPQMMPTDIICVICVICG